MTMAAAVYVVCWTAASAAGFAYFCADSGARGTASIDGLDLVGAAGAIWVSVGAATWVVWILALALWESLVWFVRSDADLSANRVGRWLSIEECRVNKAQLEGGLRSFAPNLAMSGLLVAAGDGGGLLGGDLADVYLSYVQPWCNWNQAEAQLRAGQAVWFDNPPPEDQSLVVVAPYIRSGIRAAMSAGWLACLSDLPGYDPLTITVLLALGMIITRRQQLRSWILSHR
jgi:hypothetical protein